jgi:hypothetical protein
MVKRNSRHTPPRGVVNNAAKTQEKIAQYNARLEALKKAGDEDAARLVQKHLIEAELKATRQKLTLMRKPSEIATQLRLKIQTLQEKQRALEGE